MKRHLLKASFGGEIAHVDQPGFYYDLRALLREYGADFKTIIVTFEEDLGDTPHERAVKRGESLVGAYKQSEKHWGDYREALTDMLADLFHYAHELQVDRELEQTIEDLIASAAMHFAAEIEEIN